MFLNTCFILCIFYSIYYILFYNLYLKKALRHYPLSLSDIGSLNGSNAPLKVCQCRAGCVYPICLPYSSARDHFSKCPHLSHQFNLDPFDTVYPWTGILHWDPSQVERTGLYIRREKSKVKVKVVALNLVNWESVYVLRGRKVAVPDKRGDRGGREKEGQW